MQTKEDAEELTQDTFLKAFKKLDSFKGDCSFSTWLFRIGYNTAISATRKRKIINPIIDEFKRYCDQNEKYLLRKIKVMESVKAEALDKDIWLRGSVYFLNRRARSNQRH